MENLNELLLSRNAAAWQMHYPSRRFTYVNQHLSDICGVKISDLEQNPDSLIHPEDSERVLSAFKRVREGNSMNRHEVGLYNTELLEYIEQTSFNLDAVIHKIVEKSSELAKHDGLTHSAQRNESANE